MPPLHPRSTSPRVRPAEAPRLAPRTARGRRVAALLGVGTTAGGAFAAMAVASARRATVAPDERLHGAMHAALDRPAGEAAAAVAPAVDGIGKWWVYAPVALAVAAAVLAAEAPRRPPPGARAWVARRLGHATPHDAAAARSRRAGAAAVALVPALAAALGPALDRWLPQPPVGPRRRPVDHPVFPSGHALRVTAVALVAAWVAAREELARPGRAAALAATGPALVGLSRLVREKHLASDIVGGWLAGAALAALAATGYELAGAPRAVTARALTGR